MLARLWSKSFKLGFSSRWTENFQMYKLDLEKAEEPKTKFSTFIGSQGKQRNSSWDISNLKRWSHESAVCNMPANLENSAVATELEKVSFHSSPKERQCSKFSKPGFRNTWTVNFQMFKLVLEKTKEPEIKLPTSAGSSKKQDSSRKTSISALLTTPKPLTVWITINCGKFWRRWEYQTTWPASWETCMQVRKKQLELDMEQQTGSK